MSDVARCFPRTARVAFVSLAIFSGASAASPAHPNPAVLTAIDVVDATPENFRIAVTIQGSVREVESARFGDGRFVFDLVPVVWNGPTRRERPDVPGIIEYRFSQFSRDPPITRFVLEVGTDWICLHERASTGVTLACSRPTENLTVRSAASLPTIAVVRGIGLTSPVAGLDAEQLIDRSLGYIPGDIVRDGLPHFGATRDDWIGNPRPHKGLDIYIDTATVRAVAEGEVVGTGLGPRSGSWATIRHGNGVDTTYVHISGLSVKTGDRVARGQHIAVIDGPVGNAIQPQLHFELRLDDEPVDPVPFLLEQASEELKEEIALAKQRLTELEQERASKVRLIIGEVHD